MSTEAKTPKGRSPSFPGVSLKTAVQRAQVAYDRFKLHPAAVPDFTAAWGYKAPTTGPASVTIAALRKYGLLTYGGTKNARVAKLTDLAAEILVKPDPRDAIQRAALLPPIHKEMWERFGADIPSEDALRYEFGVERGFTDTGLRDFLREYRETVTFAKLASSGIVRDDGEDHKGDADGDDQDDERRDDQGAGQDGQNQRERRREPGVLTYAVPVAIGQDVTIEGRFPLSETEWTQFMAVLQAMRPALVGETTVADQPQD